MKSLTQAFIIAMFLAAGAASAQTEPAINNPAIDMQGFLRVSSEAASARASRRISEERFHSYEPRAWHDRSRCAEP